MSADLTRRYAVSLYVDLRLGILDGREYNTHDAYTQTARAYGSDAATYARDVAG